MNCLIIFLRMIWNFDHKPSGRVDDEILIGVSGPLEIKMLIGPSVIVPDNYVAFLQMFLIRIECGDIESHLVLLCWDDLVLYVRIREGELRILIIIIDEVLRLHVCVSLDSYYVCSIFQVLIHLAFGQFILFVPIYLMLLAGVVLLLIGWLGCMEALLAGSEPIILILFRTRQCQVVSIIEVLFRVPYFIDKAFDIIKSAPSLPLRARGALVLIVVGYIRLTIHNFYSFQLLFIQDINMQSFSLFLNPCTNLWIEDDARKHNYLFYN